MQGGPWRLGTWINSIGYCKKKRGCMTTTDGVNVSIFPNYCLFRLTLAFLDP